MIPPRGGEPGPPREGRDLPPRRGRLIALEGIDGCGKTTQAHLLAEALGADLTHEPGATDLGRALRRLLLDPGHGTPTPRAEALLMAADRAQHVEETIAPALADGRWVVTDRFSGSTLAYQGWGRQLPVDPLRHVVAWATGGLEPDLSVLVDVPLAVARRRLQGASPDRLERLDADFFDRVRHGFVALARSDPDRWAVVDGTAPADEVASQIAGLVADRLGVPDPVATPPGRFRGNVPGETA
ncbi:MAG TPA: dTMP kinase [Acidimicrobiales bacterium]|nr:dTMP kinase [Acidimicrobiales bacterium]